MKTTVKQLLEQALATDSLDALVHIELHGVVGTIEVKDVYAVPASEDGETPAALHIEVGYPSQALKANPT
jgi:hypothetical protein